MRWLEPPSDKPDNFDISHHACVHAPGADPADPPALFVGAPMGTPCKHIDHNLLTGCREDPDCGAPDWSDGPPSWWPC